MRKFFGQDKIRIGQFFLSRKETYCLCDIHVLLNYELIYYILFHSHIPNSTASWTEIKIWSVVKWQFRIERRSTLEPLWCNAIYAWTRFKFRFDPGSKLNDVGATRP